MERIERRGGHDGGRYLDKASRVTLEAIGLVTLIVGFWAFSAGPIFATYAFALSTLLGAAAAVIITSIGASIQPAHLLLGFFSLVVLRQPGALPFLLTRIRPGAPGFWLLLTWIYGVLAAIFAPRLLVGLVDVNPIGVGAFGMSGSPVPISPSSGNITQSVYFTGDIVCFLACQTVARTERGFFALANALLAYAVADIVFAGLDFLTFATGTTWVLGFVRNATYSIYTDTTVEGLKRIIGSFTESSSFAYATLGSFSFSAHLCLSAIRPRLTASIALLSASLLLLSTSSTAYLALPLYLAILYLSCTAQILLGRASVNMILFVALTPIVLMLIYCAVALTPSVYDGLYNYLDLMLFNKSASQSGIERMQYNVDAIHSFVQSWGLGTGIGSVRASSFALAVLANLGVGGAAFYLAFLSSVLVGGVDRHQPSAVLPVVAAARSAAVSLLIASTISGALIDLGLPFFLLAALASTRRLERRSSPGPSAALAHVGRGLASAVPARHYEVGAGAYGARSVR